MPRALAAAVLCVLAHPAHAEVRRDGDRLLDADPAVSCRAAHAAAGAPLTCPRHARLRADRVELLSPVRFEYDKATLRVTSYPILDEVAAVLLAHPDLRVEVQGHGDDEQHRALRLTDRRAHSVRDYLVQHGVAGERLEANGYGDSVPLVMPSAPDAWRNRRIELRVIR